MIALKPKKSQSIRMDVDLVTEMVPAMYLLEGAYTWVESTLTLDALRPEWDVQPE